MRSKVTIKMPIRINFGGAWSDTPPFCLQEGGCVCNTSALINGEKPIKVYVEKIKEKKLILENENKRLEIDDINELKLLDDNNEFDLIKLVLQEIQINYLGLHILVDTSIIPRGSGLGTSSILILGILMAMYKLEGKKIEDNELVNKVMNIEKKIGTGGGWQDQAGILKKGIKIIKSNPGKNQKLDIKPIIISDKVKEELNRRLALVYTGETRESKYIVHEIMQKYQNDLITKNTIVKLKNIALEMEKVLSESNIEEFAKLLNLNYELSRTLSSKMININMKKIFKATEDITAGKMVCGAGNGGFVEILLKNGVKKSELDERLKRIFPNMNIAVWEVEIE